MRPGRLMVMAIIIAAVAALPASDGRAWFIAHSLSTSFNPATSPEMFRPASDGGHPGPGHPPAPVVMDLMPLPPGWDPAIMDALERAVTNWNGIPGSSLQISAVRPGPGSGYDEDWVTRYRVPDGRNTIEFVTRDWHTLWSNNIIARTIIVLDRDTGRIIETDMFINAEDLRWAVFPVEGSFPDLAGQTLEDVEAIITHETGHVFGIGHSQYPWASMYGAAGYANTLFRRLTNDDHEAARYVYPRTESDRPGPSIWGAVEGHLDGVCGTTYLSMISAPLYYSTNLIRSHPLAADMPYCLFGSGFSASSFQTSDLQADGFPLNTVINVEYVGPNFVKAVISNTPAVPAGAYDFAAVNQDGATGVLVQGLVLNPSGNGLPVAVIEAGAPQAEPGSWVRLDGSGSSDPDGSALSYRWWVEDSPVGSSGTLASADAAVTSLYLPAPGMYVVRLAVSDGAVESIAAQVLVRAEYSLRSGGGGGHDVRPFSCLGWIGAPPNNSTVYFSRDYLPAALIFALPLVVGLAVRSWLQVRRTRRTGHGS